MASKVKCTCGWSWNKSDSSKKDMYICHECGRDNSNNMKNGGWLDNYNDSETSAPEGFEGEGYSNVGRNYSPAWGGQFQNGGKAPLYVESKNDPRYKAYKDSLTLNKLGDEWFNNENRKKENAPLLSQERVNNALKNKPIGKKKIFNDSSNIEKHEVQTINGKKVSDKVVDTKKNKSFHYKNLYAAPQQEVVLLQRPKLEAIQNNLQPEGLVHGDLDIETELPQIRQQVRQPKYYDVEDYTHGSTNYNGRQTNYRTSDLSSLEEQSPNNTRKITPHYQMGGSVYPVNYVPQAAMGGSIPGAVGFSYARTQGAAPSNGKYAKKTMASAQNGKEMQYYQNGLDYQPKTISRDGSWLSKYDVAQTGAKKFKLKDERDLAYKPAESTNIKKKNFDLEQDKERKNYISQLADQQKETSRRKKLTQDQREREDYNARNEERGSIQAHVPESTWDRSKAIASNPLTAFGYAARNESLPARFQHGERNALDTPIDFINPLQGVAALSEIPGELGRGEFLNAGLSALDAIDLGVYAKGAGKALGTKSGLLSNAYKLNPYAERLNDANKSYRVAGMSALEDFQNTGVLRSQRILPENATFLDRVAARPTSFPSFQKGYADLDYLPKEGGAIFETALPTFKRGQINPVTGVPIGGRHYAHRVIDPKTGNALREIPASDIRAFGDKPHWLQGYKEIPKQEDGGIIKDDRGQWDHPGEITEINSNDITMEGVPYDVLGVSDTGDVKMMKPGKNYKFKGKKVTEYPMAKNGMRQEQKGLQNLDNLTNFTNYNKPTVGGWLNKYN